MIDLKKEIKLSDLVRGSSRPSASEAGSARGASAAAEDAGELVGIKIGASQLAAARVVEQRRPRSCSSSPRQPLPAGHRRRAARFATCPRSRPALDEFFTHALAAAPRRPARARDEPRRRPQLRDRRHRRRAPARERGALPRARRRLHPGRRGGASTTASSRARRRRDRHRQPEILLVAAYREPIERYVAAFREAGIQLVGDRPRGVRAAARSRAAPSAGDHGRAAVVVASTSGTSARRSPSPTAPSASSRASSSGAAPSSPPPIARELAHRRARGGASCSLALSLEPADTSTSRPTAAATRAREAVRRELQVLARELVASLEFYQAQARLARDLGDPPRRRDEPPARPRRRAREADARARPSRRPARAGAGRRRRSRTATTCRRSPSRSDWGWRTDARRQPSSRPPRRDASGRRPAAARARPRRSRSRPA